MNKIDAKKSLLKGIAGGFLLACIAMAPMTNASSSDGKKTPRLYSIREITSTSVVLPIKAKKFKNQMTTAIVSIKDRSTEMIMEKAFKVSFDEKGNGSITVKGLKSGTRYTFKVRLMRMGSSHTTKNSADKTARTN